ncbi:NEW3 domain-containing protein [Agromyces sp. NPDC058136]|uniref:NEW3 domain-containing protein n=1 Tax=Agromyces sp. NPDC058136 TaxID=3346354 RepID=UPI0036DA0299
MSSKTVRRGAVAALALASTIALAAQPAFASEEPVAPATSAPAPETEAPAESPAPEVSETDAPDATAPESAAPSAPAAPSAEARTSAGKPAADKPAAEQPAAAEAVAQPDIAVSISEIGLEGPAIAEVEVVVENGSDQAMRKVDVAFSGPVGWQVVAVEHELSQIKKGKQGTATFQVRIPEQRPGFALRVFTANVSYTGGDGAGSATTTRAVPTAAPLADLAAAFNNVGITSEQATGAGAFDSEGNSFSAEQLAAAGAGPGAVVEALGASLQMPASAPGTPDNVAASGQAISLPGQGERLVLLGSGSGTGATGTATVFYTDGTTSSGAVGFPNWSFQAADAHGATLAVATNGRNRPSGYGDSAYQYRMFAHSVALDPAKTVEFVVLPANASMHVFAVGIAP